MFILRNDEDIVAIKNYLKSKNMEIEYNIFEISINTGIPVSSLVEIKLTESLLKSIYNGYVKINDKKYFLSDKMVSFFKDLNKSSSMNEYIFTNHSHSNHFNRSQFYSAMNKCVLALKISKTFGNKDLEYTFAYHYLLQVGNIAYLKTLFNKSEKEILLKIFDFENNKNSYKNFYL